MSAFCAREIIVRKPLFQFWCIILSNSMSRFRDSRLQSRGHRIDRSANFWGIFLVMRCVFEEYFGARTLRSVQVWHISTFGFDIQLNMALRVLSLLLNVRFFSNCKRSPFKLWILTVLCFVYISQLVRSLSPMKEVCLQEYWFDFEKVGVLMCFRNVALWLAEPLPYFYYALLDAVHWCLR